MKRSPLRVGLVLAVLGVSAIAGCGSSDDAGSTSAGTNDLESRLLADTGVRWIVDRDDASRPLFLTAPDAPPPIAASTPRDRAAIEFLQRYADAFGAGRLADELVLLRDEEDPVTPGVHHLRFGQRIPGSGVRVFGADTFAHFDQNEALRFAAIGLVVDIARISPHAKVTADQARQAAEAHVRARDGAAVIDMKRAPVLVVHRAADGHGTLAWRVALRASVQGQLEAPEIFVDAASLAIVEANDRAAHANKKATVANFYNFHSDCKGAPKPPTESAIEYDDAYMGPIATGPTNRLYREGDSTRSTIITDRYLAGSLTHGAFFTEPTITSDPALWDQLAGGGHQGTGAAVSTHENLAITDAHFRKVFGQRGWDDILPDAATGPNPIRVAVHAWTIDVKKGKTNVEDIDGYLDEVIYLGDGIVAGAPLGAQNCEVLPSGVALDIVAHEFTHGVAEFSARLDNHGESGAINEALADILAAGVEQAVRPGDHNYVIGEDSRVGTGGIRSMREPKRFDDTRPRSYSERKSLANPTEDNDFGHVHDNSVIASHAYFLMNEGGQNARSNVVVDAASALGWQRSQFLWYLTLRGLDRRFATTFHDLARVNTNLSIFFGNVSAVACAWRAVEVLSDAEVKAYGVTCTKGPKASTPPPAPAPGADPALDVCSGHGDSPVCSEAAPSSASTCKNGVRTGTAFCADLGQRCRRASASDATASFDADGALVCE